MRRILALDVGDRRIGFAVSDPLCITAQGLETYTRATDDIDKDVEYICEMAKKYAPVKLLYGLPKNMDGSLGFSAQKVLDLAELVSKHTEFEHDFYDERLTTMMVERVLYEEKLDWKKRRKVVDKLAAVVILQGYLDSGLALK
ncbi:MAG: Holliday junction resolvase RuvX [Clostridia bacterium]|nr:Holliday junction resolvase RuvX [Clostridia bacterium]